MINTNPRKLPWQSFRKVDDGTFDADLERKVDSGELTQLEAAITIGIDRLLARGAVRVEIDDDGDGPITLRGIIEDHHPLTITFHREVKSGRGESRLTH